ncbi:diguanylate cyclase [Roseateles sp. DAIF2]|uniref:diguanylate cyclase domain-containing protein n=1 Tax=Roseateles sp. DAIF2 TaxID=2714952 RepID=UPI0018A32F6A|nr:diguanylate cyclase [Roseateles sp. DAIF2]QPF76106.1 diguanylate cyclase [Roseateles sp. DAIF2]
MPRPHPLRDPHPSCPDADALPAASRWLRRSEFRHPRLIGALLGRLLEQDPTPPALTRRRIELEHARFRCVEVMGAAGPLLPRLLDCHGQARERGWNAESARMLCAVGRIRYGQGEYREAAQHWASAIDIARLGACVDAEVEARIGLGQVYDALGDGKTAARLHGDASVLAETLGDDYLISKVAINQGFNLRVIGAPEAAREQFERALAAARRGRIRHYVGESLWQLADLGLQLGHPDAALAPLAEARHLAETAGNGWLLSGIYRTWAEILARQGKTDQAAAAYHQALRQAEAAGARRQLADCHEALARLTERAGDLAGALHHTRAAKRLQTELVHQLHVAGNLEALRQYDLSERPPLEQLLAVSQALPQLGGDNKAAGLQLLCQAGLGVLRADRVSVWEWNDDDADGGVALGAQAASPAAALQPLEDDMRRYVDTLRPQFAERSELRVLHDIRTHPDFARLGALAERLQIRAALEVPLYQQERLVGMLVATRQRDGQPWSRDEVLFAAHLGAQASQLEAHRRTRQIHRALLEANETLELRVAQRTAELERSNQALSQANEALRETSLTDPLTGLRNRRYLLQHIESDAALALRNEASREDCLIFYLVDIDHFKSINDNHGHEAGDQVLAQVAQRIRACSRRSSHVVRWGGEEFLVVARRASMEHASLQAQRFCEAFHRQPFLLGQDRALTVTCSVGYALLPMRRADREHLAWNEVLELADQALYWVKQNGRDGWLGVLPRPDAALPAGPLSLQTLHGAGLVELRRPAMPDPPPRS